MSVTSNMRHNTVRTYRRASYPTILCNSHRRKTSSNSDTATYTAYTDTGEAPALSATYDSGRLRNSTADTARA